MRRGYISLWLLLATAFVVVAVVSCFDEVKIGSHAFKTASIARELTRRDFWEVDSGAMAAAESTAPDTLELAEVKFPQPLDTTAKTILFFGDSMLEGLSPRLAAYCEENGHTLYTVIWYSSTTQVWGSCDTLTTFIKRFDPDYIVACLGANELFVRDIAQKREQPLNHLLGEIGDRPLLWIGPPNWKDDTGINDLLQERLGPGRFFLSNGMTFDRKRDGAHPTAASAALWMDSVARWMPEHAAHPIKMSTPTKQKGRAARVTVLQPLK